MMWVGVVVFTALVNYGVGEVSPWWSSAVYYRLLVDSFKDGDGDGLGDLKGLSKQISYVRALGADAIILSSLSSKNPDCSQPGIIQHTEIDQRYGNLEEFSNVLEKAKKIELKILITLPLQTISTASEWFKSSADKINGFEDWILWREGTAEEMPQLENGVDTWTWHEDRGAHFGVSGKEALLNLCSEGVAAALAAALCAWLRRGISGVLLNPDFPMEQRCGEQLLRKMVVEALNCARSFNLNTPVILADSSLSPELAAKYYSNSGVGANSVLSRSLTSPVRSNAPEIALAIYADLLYAPDDMAPTWITSIPNENRIATRHSSDMVDAINLLSLILPGSAVIQQGDELGAADTIMEWATSSTCWPSEAVPSAAPFPWDDSPNTGFTAGEPWLPFTSNYKYANAKSEFNRNHSHVGIVRIAAAMRKSPAFGPHLEIKRLGDALAILRWGTAGSLLVLTNLARDQTEAQLSRIHGLPTEMTVAASSTGSSLSTGSHVTIDKTIKLIPGETLLLAGGHRHCGGPGPVDKIANKLSEGWQKINKYFSNI
ncbi:neutral and basic amino acid transport protein rBAT-like [Galleria mellonella]|uniref:alpha-glucosidase n=1 Tax=Galleria mellonella TaxID=7137 RepID=A0A6J3BTN8_GALME|nr:neutral and basic amino acid transport protein rBAT-like [Galleria mellonella]